MASASQPKVLYLVHRVPYPPDKGDRIRAFNLLKELARTSTVHLAYLTEEPATEAVATGLQPYCERQEAVRLGRWVRWCWAASSWLSGASLTEGAFWTLRLKRLVRRWARETNYDAVVVSASSLVPYLRLPELRSVPAIVDLVDVDSQKWLDYATSSRGPRAWLYGSEGRRLRRLEQALPTWTRAVTLVSKAEVRLYRQFCSEGQVYAITNGVDQQFFQPMPSNEEECCVFVGQMDYWPNVDGVCWFCEEVWPTLQQRRPRAKLYLVGRSPTPAVQRLASLPGVVVVGAVTDVRPYVSRAAVVIAPLRIARGVQNKVLEALAMAKAVVASPQALAGLKATPGEHLLAASSTLEWVNTLNQLLAHPEQRATLGREGRRYAEEHHDWNQCLALFGEIVRGAPPGDGEERHFLAEKRLGAEPASPYGTVFAVEES